MAKYTPKVHRYDALATFNERAADRKQYNARLEFCFFVREIYDKGHITVSDLMQLSGLSRAGIAKILSFVNTPSQETIEKLRPAVETALTKIGDQERQEIEESAKNKLPGIVLAVDVLFSAAEEAKVATLINSGLLASPEIQRKMAQALARIVHDYAGTLQTDLKSAPQTLS